MILQKMTDFVLEVKNRCNPAGFKDFSFMSEYQSIFNYAEFLKLSLKLNMFIPLRQDGTIITEPIPRKTSQKRYPYELRDWREAKENVLFKGFKISESHIENSKHTIFLENPHGDFVGHKHDWEENWDLYGTTVEGMLNLVENEIELTESAKKEIFGDA